MDSSPVDALACPDLVQGRLLQGRKGSTAPVPAPVRRLRAAQHEAGGGDMNASPMPPRPLRLASQKWDGQRQAEKPGGAEGNRPPCDDERYRKVIGSACAGDPSCRAHKSMRNNSVPCQDRAADQPPSAGVVEHILDTLVQRGHDHIAEQSVEARQQQRQHHSDEDLDGSVDVALTGAAGGGKADGLGADELAVFLIIFFL